MVISVGVFNRPLKSEHGKASLSLLHPLMVSHYPDKIDVHATDKVQITYY